MSDGNVVGGLVGSNNINTISASYSSGSVMGSDAVGGLIGFNSAGRISASYSSGSVMGTDNVGGLAGGDFGGNIATSWWDTTTSSRIFGIGTDDSNRDNIEDSGEVNLLKAHGLTTTQMRASSTTFPNFGAVADIVGTADPDLPSQLGNFSAAWDYTANCYPRLMRWTGAGGDNTVGTNDDTFHASELLPGQGTPAAMDGACAGTP